MALTKDSTIIKPVFENIPIEMKSLSRWVCWKAIERDGKITKMPFQPNGQPAKSNDESTWSRFDAVAAAGSFDGIGFMLGDGYIGIDIDGCIDEQGYLAVDHAKDILNSVDSYYEQSVSGTGVHIILKGELPEGYKNKNTKLDIEVYSNRRFFCTTGKVKTPKPVKNDQKGLLSVLNKYFKKEAKQPPQKGERALNLSDNELWEKMFNSKNGQAIKALFNGDLSAHDYDPSAADQALCNHLAFWTNKDYSKMDSMFRESGLMRDKWDENRGQSTYGYITLTKAIDDCQNGYSPEEEFKIHINQNWKDNLEYGITKQGEKYLLKNGRNIELILENCIGDKIAYNVFANEETVLADLPWRKVEALDEWKNADFAELAHWFDVKWNLKNEKQINNAFIHVLHKRSFHPIKDYLESSRWDGELRIPYLFHNFLGVEDTSFNREIAVRFFTGAVKRVYQPGCKHDWSIVLVGGQGLMKSWLIEKIAACDTYGELTSFDAKDGGEQLRGKWILEIPELAAKKKSNNEEMKAFMSRRSDDYRAAYARKTEKRPRTAVLVGTSNDMEFITDETGDRRNVPLVCRKEHTKMDVSVDLTPEFTSQLWAEAKVYFDEGKESYLDKQLETELSEMQTRHKKTDPLQDEVVEYAESIEVKGRSHLCVREIWDHVVTDDPKKKPTPKDSARIVKMLTAMGYKRTDKKKWCGDYGSRDAYAK